uniref:Uncharacterized protein n=1 Tax=Candidatus Kentrum sp. LFY TaxID=2126342 RepID=A0A450WGU4_9GAMM|nr:MAG: hypothetical protein BECKLFY1418C_GA0070996_102126 [Candidatus Kentron sp. LFY]
MIVRELENAAIGQFVLLSGSLKILDASIFKRIIGSEIIRRFIKGEYRKSENTRRNKTPRKRANISDGDPFDMGMEFVSMFPYTIQASITGKYDSWSVLKEEFMATMPEHLMLEYDESNIGEWNMLGILDAKPSRSNHRTIEEISKQLEETVEQLEDDREVDGGDNPNAAIKLMANLFGTMAKAFVGRSEEQYGMTSLMIFREVAGQQRIS